MDKRRKKSLRIRRRWALNPKTRIKEGAKIYHRHREKGKAQDNYEEQNKT